MPTDQSGLWQTPIGQTWGRSTSWADSDHNLFFCKIVEDGFLDPAQYLWLSLYNLNTKFIKYQKISLFFYFLSWALFIGNLEGGYFSLLNPEFEPWPRILRPSVGASAVDCLVQRCVLGSHPRRPDEDGKTEKSFSLMWNHICVHVCDVGGLQVWQVERINGWNENAAVWGGYSLRWARMHQMSGKWNVMLSCNDAGNFQSILKLKMIKCEVYRSFQTLGWELWRSTLVCTLARIVYPRLPNRSGGNVWTRDDVSESEADDFLLCAALQKTS